MKDVIFTDKLVKVCDNLLLAGHKQNHKKMDKLYKELALLLEERFNIRYEVHTGMLLATIPPISSVGTAIADLNYKSLVEASNDEDLIKFMEDNNKVFDIDSGFYLDYKNKTIEYKGKNKFKAYIYIEPIKLARVGLTGHEFASALLHEVGHDFEFLRYTIYTTRKAEKLITNIREAVHEKASIDKLIEIITKEVNIEHDEIENMDLIDKIQVVLKVPEKIFEFNSGVYSTKMNLGNTVVSGKEFEMLADDFVRYFNMEHFLPGGLNKINIYYKTLSQTSMIIYMGFLQDKIAAQLFSAGWGSFVTQLTLQLLYILFLSFIYSPLYDLLYPILGQKTRIFIAKFITGLVNLYTGYDLLIILVGLMQNKVTLQLYGFGIMATLSAVRDYFINYREKDSITVFPYENSIDRYKAIKQNLIDKIKKSKDLETKKIILDKITMVDKEIKQAQLILTKYSLTKVLPNMMAPLDHRDGNYLNPIYTLTAAIREHMNNDLYIGAAKLDIHNRE